MKQICLTLLLAFGVAAASSVAALPHDRFAAMLDTADEQIVQRAVVPSTEQPQGEVQLIRRNGLLVVRTLLASRVLKRVGAAIDAKERRNWPESRDGHTASSRYRDELFRAVEQSWEKFRQRHDPTELRQFLSIEFLLADDNAAISLAVPQLTGDYGSMSLSGQELIQVWRAAPHYVHDNIIEIVRDSFQLDEQAATRMLAPLWPDSDHPGP